jgi:hypothetical protein
MRKLLLLYEEYQKENGLIRSMDEVIPEGEY